MQTNEPTKQLCSDLNPHLDVASLNISAGAHLPHWQCNNAIYHVSFRLADSIPQVVRDQWTRERKEVFENERNGTEVSKEIKIKMDYLLSEKVDKFLDTGQGACYLKHPEIAKMVANTITCFDNIRYRLHAWCVMPNHVHIIVEPIFQHKLDQIIHAWKSITAHKANAILKRSGIFWQQDAYNHIIRSKKEYNFQISYTWENPDKARLKGWQWRWKREGTLALA